MKILSSIITVLFLALFTTLSGQQVSISNEEFLNLFENGNTLEILKILEKDPQQMNVDLGTGMTPLHWAAYFGNVSVFDYLLQKGADLNAQDQRGLAPVWFTVSGQRPAMLRKLITLGADLSNKNPQGDNMLFRAITARNPELVQILLDNGFDPMQKNDHEMTPIEHATGMNSVEILNQLISKGADLRASSSPEFPLLHRAAVSQGAESLHYLLDRGFMIDEKDNKDRTPLMVAVEFGNMDAARALILRGADINLANSDGIFPMQIAIKKGSPDLIDLFIANKADLTVVEERTGKSMLHEAALRGNSAVVRKLLEAGIPKNVKDRNGYTALSYALKYGNKTTADLLKQAGVENIAWETNLDDLTYLNKPLAKGEAYIWYLRHSGWALKTRSALLVFDYWDDDNPPDEKLLANGHIKPEEIKGIPTYVFASHDHGDHFDRQILDWRSDIPGITYVFGFETQGEEEIITLPPRTQREVGPLSVTTIESNDAGVGFAVDIDGLTIFHAGDHSNNTLEMKDNTFFPEIDFMAEKGIQPDISFFLNMYGCGSSNPEAFQKGIFYAVDKLKIKSVLPMHGADREWVYENLADGVNQNKIKVDVGVAVNQGDRFFYSKRSLTNPWTSSTGIYPDKGKKL
jgi:ankyrin repeat protein/L-ascorbate metabolism protein UlaG (beta-lactamase superfamily)